MKRIVLYRYYHKLENNKQLIKFLKFLNPGIEIYGLFGGSEDQYNEATEFLKDELTHNYLIKDKDTNWKWKNGDMTYQLWYNDFGHTIDFDFMHAVEWDLLYFEPLDKLFEHVPVDSLGVTGLIPISKIKDRWFWITDPSYHEEWLQMIDFFKKKYNYNQQPHGFLGPGATLPRAFLEKIKDIEIPPLNLDELRIPMLAQTLGFNMVDTKFYNGWFSKYNIKFFNCVNFFVSKKNIENQLRIKKGYRAFHPFRDDITFEYLVKLHHISIDKNNIGDFTNSFKDFILKNISRILNKFNKDW